LGLGLTTPPRLKNIVTKSEEVKTGPICRGRHRKGLNDLRVGSWNVLCWSRYENIRGQELEGIPPQQRRMGKASLRRPGPTRGCRASDDDDDDNRQVFIKTGNMVLQHILE
jgi:hypothetical protein